MKSTVMSSDTNGGPATAAYYVLNPRTLGRPVHLIDKFTAQLRGDIEDRFCTPLNRRYRAAFEVAGVSLSHLPAPVEAPQHRRQKHHTDSGSVCFALDRALLLCVLDYRFGTRSADSAVADSPSSASEERLSAMLGSQLVSIVSARIGANRVESAASPRPDITEDPAGIAMEDAWTLRVDISERSHNTTGCLWFYLDAGCVETLLTGLSASVARTATRKSSAAVQSLPKRLKFTLTARLLDMEIALGALLDTSIGDVIPISLRGADVLVGGSRVFTASVAEHRGKLCLTSFEDVE